MLSITALDLAPSVDGRVVVVQPFEVLVHDQYGGGGRVAPHVFGWYGGSATVLVSIHQLLRSCELARFKANHLTARFADLLALHLQ